MKAVILTLALAAAASAASANAQIPGRGIPTTTASRSTSVDGSWRVVGRDQSGTIYERSTYDRYGNIVVQRARRDANGNFRILSTRTVPSNGRNDCQVSGSNGSVSDIIFGRSGSSGTYDCRSNGSTADGVWRRVGNNNGNSRIYVRRVYDRNGNVVVQRARRNPNGTFTILNSRTVRNNGNNRDDDRWDNRRGDDDDDRWENRNDRNDDRWDNRQDNWEQNGKGKGKGKKGRD